MANNKNIILNAAVRGFRVYKASWKPKEDELLECSHGKDNPYDSFSIKVFKPDSPAEIVGHLPMEISRITKVIINRGAQVAVKILARHYRGNPLVQGGLEVHCEIKITMVRIIINHNLLVRYELLLKELHTEPKDEEIIGTSLSIRNEHENVNQEIEIEIKAVQTEPLKKTGQKKTEVKSKDIRDMFQNPHQKLRQNPHHDSRRETQNVIVIISCKIMKKKAYRYKINLHFLFLTTICHKGGKFLEIRGFFSIFFVGINFRGFNKIEYFAGTNFCDIRQKPREARKLIPAKISTTKVLTFLIY